MNGDNKKPDRNLSGYKVFTLDLYLIICLLINPTKIPTIIGKKEISVYESETLNIRISISVIVPTIYRSTTVANPAVKGTQKYLLTNSTFNYNN